MAAFDTTQDSYTIQIGSYTDLGGTRNHENQDECFTWKGEGLSQQITINGVLDGHGKYYGKLCAQWAKEVFIQEFQRKFSQPDFNTVEILIETFDIAQDYIKSKLKEYLETKKVEFMEEDTYLLSRNNPAFKWSLVSGGTTCTIVALVGHELYIANVGDSNAILCSTSPILSKSMIEYIADAGIPDAEKHAAKVAKMNFEYSQGVDMSNNIILTSDHSPENPLEYYRLRDAKCKEDDPMQPEICVVYDKQDIDKPRCPPVFKIGQDGNITRTNKGAYYKNVRKEWASLVTTPSDAKYQDALAFTRSLGDFSLNSYGVDNKPEVTKIDLCHILGAENNEAEATKAKNNDAENNEAEVIDAENNEAEATDAENNEAEATDAENNEAEATEAENNEAENNEAPTLVIVLATDGVWDHWSDANVAEFVLHGSCLKVVSDGPGGADRVTKSFMERNHMYSIKNFGASADNATSIIMYVKKE